jgi:hypothetical protein
MSALDDTHNEIGRLVRAMRLLSDFEDKHRDFLRRCVVGAALFVDGRGTPSIAFYKDQAGDVAQYFGNDGWTHDAPGRRSRKIDQVEVAVIGLDDSDVAAQTGPLFGNGPCALHHLNVVGADGVCQANVPTIEASPIHGVN